MGHEYVLRVQMKNGANRTVRAWGWSAGDAYQKLKKEDPDVLCYVDGWKA